MHVPIFGSDEVADVTGAGDTVIATLALALAAGAIFYEAARLANYAGGLVVMKRGTATVSRRRAAPAPTVAEDRAAVDGVKCRDDRTSASSTKRTLVDVGARASRDCAADAIAFANGCFDLLHVGHVRYLQAAAAEADRLIVAVNDDASVAALKGPGRPILPAADRAELVAALRGVDYVVIFRRADGRAAARRCCSRTCTARAPTTPSTPCPSAAVVEAYGGRTAIVGDPKNHATRELLARIAAVVRTRE